MSIGRSRIEILKPHFHAAAGLTLLGILILSLNPILVQANTQVSSQEVNINTEDGIQLTGQLLKPTSQSVSVGIILIPGGFKGGISYDSFFSKIPTLLASIGYAVFSVNMRTVNSFSTSTFEDSLKDIRAAVQYVRGLGLNGILLAGHSMGANRVVYYEAETRDPDVMALVLYAAGGVPKSFVPQYLGQENYTMITTQASNLVAGGRGNQTVYSGSVAQPSPSSPEPESFSAQTWLSWIGPNSSLDTFRSIRAISIPVIILVHVKDSVARVDEKYHNATTASPKSDFKLYTVTTSGNPHNFQGFEDQAVQDTSNWIQTVPEFPLVHVALILGALLVIVSVASNRSSLKTGLRRFRALPELSRQS